MRERGFDTLGIVNSAGNSWRERERERERERGFDTLGIVNSAGNSWRLRFK